MSKKILIIDDSPIDARVAAKMLADAGYEAIIAHDGFEGVELARVTLPDMILVDVNMPKMDGYQVCERLKAEPETRRTLTVLYTARDQFLDYLKGVEAGADDFIVKTASTEEFLGRIKHILTERRRSGEVLAEHLNLKPIALLAQVLPREELVGTWYSTFSKHVRQTMSLVLGSHPTGVLTDRAMDKALTKNPIFLRSKQGQQVTFLFDPWATAQIPLSEMITGCQSFINELYDMVIRLTRARASGSSEAKLMSKAFQEMIAELQAEYDKAAAAAKERPVAATPEAVLPVPVDQGEQEPAIEKAQPMMAPKPTVAGPLPGLECTLDANGVFIYINDDMAQVLGYDRVELMGRPFMTLLAEPGSVDFDEAIEQLKKHGRWESKLQLQTQQEARLHVMLGMMALYDTEGDLVMMRCKMEVVPDTELAEETDQEAERLKEALDRAKQALHQADEGFADLASIISHDLRQPLHAVLLLCQFLQEESAGQLQGRGREYLASIEKAASRMKQMVEDVVHYARITSSSNAYEPVDLNQLLDEVREGLAPQLSERRATLLQKGELPVVTCDRERFKELFAHLISNGIKFNDKTQPIAVVTLAKQDADGYTFSVWDNGIGIEEPYHETIFRLFQRLHKPEEYSGSGAGLAICRRIVESHGGRIWLRSQLGEGSTFFFTLPASQLLVTNR